MLIVQVLVLKCQNSKYQNKKFLVRLDVEKIFCI